MARPVAKTCRFGFPLKDYAAKPARLRSPVEAPLLNFQSRRSTPLFVPSAPRPCPLRGRTAQTLPFRSRLWKFTTEPGNPDNARPSWLMPTLEPGINHASRAAPR